MNYINFNDLNKKHTKKNKTKTGDLVNKINLEGKFQNKNDC